MSGNTRAAGAAAIPGRPSRTATIEFLVGLLVLLLLAGVLALALVGNDRRTDDGYRLTASFSHVDGLSVGGDVKLAGVTVGRVLSERVDPRTYMAEVVFTVRRGVALPTDSSAIVTSDSLLGGKYLALDPGGADTILRAGGRMTLTQGSISLEQLLSKFIFSVTDAMSAQKKQAAGSPPSPPPSSLPAASPPGGGAP